MSDKSMLLPRAGNSLRYCQLLMELRRNFQSRSRMSHVPKQITPASTFSPSLPRLTQLAACSNDAPGRVHRQWLDRRPLRLNMRHTSYLLCR
jgi:hypothetical protein